MNKYYIAVTYEVCDHNHLYLDMNEYHIESLNNLDQQVKKLAGEDIAPVVKVFESDTKDFIESRLFKEYTFKEYGCGCDGND